MVYGGNYMRSALRIEKYVVFSYLQKFLSYCRNFCHMPYIQKTHFFRFLPIFGFVYFGLWVVWAEIAAGMKTPQIVFKHISTPSKNINYSENYVYLKIEIFSFQKFLSAEAKFPPNHAEISADFQNFENASLGIFVP